MLPALSRVSGASRLARHRGGRTASLQRLCGSRFASTESQDAGTFDYVVVGAGSAGCVLANRLSADGSSVAVLEAGGRDNYHFLHIPIGYLYMMRQPQRRANWGFSTTPQPGLHGRSLGYPRGKTLGGCAAVNGMIMQRGQPDDYDFWGDLLGDESWGWEAMRPSFERLIDYRAGERVGPDGKERGTGGPQVVSTLRLSWDVLDKFADACEAAGIPRRTHFHDSACEGVGYFEVTQRRGVRHSAYRAFLHPVRSRPNLTIHTNAHASRVLFDSDPSTGSLAAKGVEFWRRAKRDTLREALRAVVVDHTDVIKEHGDHGPKEADELCVVRARKEVILSLGSIGSPHLLQCSGVGNDSVLRQHGVATVADVPGVGENLHDHLQIRMCFRLREGIDTLNGRANSLVGKARIALEYGLFQSGPMSMAPSQLGVFAKSASNVSSPDLQWHVQPLSLDSWEQPLHPWPGLTASVCHLRPTSRGSVRLTSADTRDPPTIDPAYLSTTSDRAVAAAALRKTRSIGMLLDPDLGAQEHVPGAQLTTDEELADAAGRIGTSIFHPAGTTAMGPSGDPSAVLDERLRVRDGRGGVIAGLRVADCGVMPRLVSGNTSIPTMAIAEKASRMILGHE